MEFSVTALSANGFQGWLSFPEARLSGSIPVTGGVYVVSYPLRGPVAFLAAAPGGRFKGKDPTVSQEVLAANWLDHEIVYIGKADNLRRRIREFADFGAGKPIGHWGGRLIWQLAAPDKLRIAWKETPESVPRAVEKAMLAEFRLQHGKPPFANDPQRMGL